MLALLEQCGDDLVRGRLGLQAQQAGDDLQVVLRAVMKFLDQDLLFGQRVRQPGVFSAQPVRLATCGIVGCDRHRYRE